MGFKDFQYLEPDDFLTEEEQICALFDSIMRGYPINTFMFWELSCESKEIRKDYRFYQFLEHYCERFAENNPEFDLSGHGDFFAVIDGQQRLNSFYIGLKGTYAYKLPRKWWPKTRDEGIIPSRSLYLNLNSPVEENADEENMVYNFRFLTAEELEEGQKNTENYWFKVGDILNFANSQTDDGVVDVVIEFLEKKGWLNKRSRRKLFHLYFAVRRNKNIHFYRETSQDIDHVLNVFIRTNHGGTSLTYSDLLMSFTVVHWKKDARKQIEDLIYQIRFGSDMEFSINKDFLLKAALMISGIDVRFKIDNFSRDKVARIESDWEEIKACMLETFRLIRSFGINDLSLRSKNSVIPIAYYLFHKNRDQSSGNSGLYSDINNPARHGEDRQRIKQWLHMSLLKGIFSGQTDSLLSNLRNIINANLLKSDVFPLPEIIQEYRGTTKDLNFDDDFTDRLLKTQKNDAACFSILSLLFPDIDYSRALDIDHLHPCSAFQKEQLDKMNFSSPGQREFYENPENWNGIANLCLLNSSVNKSKQDIPLEKWVEQQKNFRPEDMLILDTDLFIEGFEKFIQARAALLKERLREINN